MKIYYRHIFFFTLLLCLVACGNHSKNEVLTHYTADEVQDDIEEIVMGEAMPIDEQTPPPPPPSTEKSPTIERKLIKEGEIRFETEDLASTQQRIHKAVKKYQGYISSEQEYESSGELLHNITIRVPSDHFDTLLNAVSEGVGHFDRKDIQVNDVTEEFVDIQARIKTKKELEQRYIELLKKATTVGEILQIERQIGELRSTIESIEGRLKYLQDRVSYSALTISFYKTISHSSSSGNKFVNSFKNGWDNFVGFFILLLNIWPFLLVLALFVAILIMYLKKSNR